MDGSTYHVSRALYRRLAPQVAINGSSDPGANRQRVLDACEQTMLRIEREPYFARPDRYLFGEIRAYFPVHEQAWLRKMIEFHVAVARHLVEELRLREPATCGAFTRHGTPCQREPSSGSEFCPSHRHLERMEAGTRAG